MQQGYNSVNFDQYGLTDLITAEFVEPIRIMLWSLRVLEEARCLAAELTPTEWSNMAMLKVYKTAHPLDLSGQAIMIDTGSLELKDGVEYIFDNAVIFDTGYTTEYGVGITDGNRCPYGTTITMNGGEINGLYPKTETGDVVGLIIGGLQGGDNEGALNLDIDGVTLNNIIGFATGTGDRTTSSFTGSTTPTYLLLSVSRTAS